MDTKNALRQQIQSRINEMSDYDRIKESSSICQQLLELIPNGSVVCAYAPLPNEVDINPLLDDLLARGDTIYMPRLDGDGIMHFYKIHQRSELTKGNRGILEPNPDAASLDPSAVDVTLIPGRAFDQAGNRLGRGGGAYDRWIEQQRSTNPNTLYIGIGFACQIIDHVPVEEHDQPIDTIVNTSAIIQCDHH